MTAKRMPARIEAKSANRRSRARKAAPRLGLMTWAERVLSEIDRAGEALDADPVHDLRVAIRRCRSMAEGLRSLDPVPEWKEFRALAKPLFCALGELRDVQVQQHWLAKLAPENDALRRTLELSLALRAAQLKVSARTALVEFDRKRWAKLSRRLDRRIRSMRPGSLVLQLLALERLLEAERLHGRALRSRRAGDVHRLRIGIKRFRYTVENFLPTHHREWKSDLKHAQDLLGDIHDLDVLFAEIARIPALESPIRESWNARLATERASRLNEYLQMIGGGELWLRWRGGLPAGRQLSTAIQTKLRRWSAALDDDRRRSRRVATIAVALWRGLTEANGLGPNGFTSQHVRIAAWLLGVAARKRRGKRLPYLSRKLTTLPRPVGWTPREMTTVCLALQYSCDDAPRGNDREFQRLPHNAQRDVLRLAGVLRLANALDHASQGAAVVPQVESRDGIRVIRVGGFRELSPGADEVAAARHLLEFVEGHPLLVLPLAKPVRRRTNNR